MDNLDKTPVFPSFNRQDNLTAPLVKDTKFGASYKNIYIEHIRYLYHINNIIYIIFIYV